MDSYKKLYRSKTNRMLAGVCGGLGEYFNIDPVIFRIAVVLTGVGLIAYLAAIIIIPEE